MLRVVGDRLSEWAQQETKLADFFARSAFNRYYYDSFLQVRELLRTLNIGGRKPSHSQAPRFLADHVLKEVRKSLKKARKSNLIDDAHKEELERNASAALVALSQVLTQARNLRVVADYEPEVSVKRSEDIFTLNETTLQSAGNWPRTTNKLVEVVWNALREAGRV